MIERLKNILKTEFIIPPDQLEKIDISNQRLYIVLLWLFKITTNVLFYVWFISVSEKIINFF